MIAAEVISSARPGPAFGKLEMIMRPHDLPFVVVVVDRRPDGMALRIVNDYESLRTILDEEPSSNNEPEILDLEAVVIDAGDR
jgi:hypothetical protein